MQIVKFYYALKQSKNPTVDGEPIVYADWEDDTETDNALRVKTETHTILVYPTDNIKPVDKTTIVVSIGAKDHEFRI